MIKLSPGLLQKVSKPARYTGGEWNSVVKDSSTVEICVALAFPDVYEVAMSHAGLKILYHILNRRSDTMAERVFSPWVDMEEEMRKAGIPLHTLESKRPVSEFDLLGFTLQYELSYTNILNMMDLAGIPLRSADRSLEHPFVMGGGPCAFNAEPLADFFDFFSLGESEEAIQELAVCYLNWKKAGKPGGRQGFLKRVAQVPGTYVPSFYEVVYQEDGRINEVRPICPEAEFPVIKRVVADLENVDYPVQPIVPFLESVHDRAVLEVFRGCTRGCRFCQASMLYRPVRERKPETIIRIAREIIDNTGYGEISLSSLSTADYSHLPQLVDGLIAEFAAEGVNVSLPSLRVDSFSVELAQKIQEVRKSGLTFAPEAGTQRLRDVINKGVEQVHIENAVRSAFKSGWNSVKLYFMLGLPTETDEDLAGIAKLAHQMLDIYQEVKGRRGAKVTISVSSFVPKPHSAFQWFGQIPLAEIQRRQLYLKSLIRNKNITYHYHESHTSFLEGVFARGDRRLGAALQRAWELGARYDGWTEHFKYDVWMQAFSDTGLNPQWYAERERMKDEILPWDHLSTGADKTFYWQEYQQALNEQTTSDCRRESCLACGVCQNIPVSVVDWKGKL